ncbi:MAG TPA: peptide chain release factor 1, partial [Armatimonadetes bacterium]|nr:peptide chain release factor 1 [Armatimonadota bacterium]
MLEKLNSLEAEFREIERALSQSDIAGDPARLQQLLKRHGELAPVIEKYHRYRDVLRQLEEVRELVEEEEDEELRELAEEEMNQLSAERERLEMELLESILPKDPNEGKTVIVEIRAGTGGEEAALFAADLYRMYTRYAERKGWKVETLHAHPTALGGFKEVIMAVSGKDAWRNLKYESGVHRVQRIPITEAGGRIHTSTATVAILPEADEVDVQIDENDLEIETMLSSGPGGQHMQKNETAVRIRHKPTGIVVVCQDQRSQYQNRLRALRILRSRLLEMKRQEQEREMMQARRAQIGTGDRSEKTRTYNFPQNRVTDHRIGLTVYNLPE